MAITVLSSGASASLVAASVTIDVTVTAGAGNRKLLIAFVCEGDVELSAVTFNSQNLVALGQTVSNSQFIPADSLANAVFYEQYEAGMPAPGTHAITTTVGSGGGECRIMYWLLDGVRQDQAATGANTGETNGATSTATSSVNITAGSTDSFIATAFYRNDNATSINLTSPTPTAQFTDITVSGGGRLRGAYKLGGLTAGSNTVTWTTQATGQSRRAMTVAMVNPIAGGSLTVSSSSFSAGSATSSASAVRGHPVSTAAFSAGSASSSASASRGRAVSTAAFSAGSASAAASAVRGHPVATSAFTAGTVSVSASAVRGHPVSSASFSAGSASASASANRGHPVSAAAFTAGSASASASASHGFSVTAAFVCGAASFSAEASTSHILIGRNVSGDQLVKLTGSGNQTLESEQPIIIVRTTGSGRQGITTWTS